MLTRALASQARTRPRLARGGADAASRSASWQHTASVQWPPHATSRRTRSLVVPPHELRCGRRRPRSAARHLASICSKSGVQGVSEADAELSCLHYLHGE